MSEMRKALAALREVLPGADFYAPPEAKSNWFFVSLKNKTFLSVYWAKSCFDIDCIVAGGDYFEQRNMYSIRSLVEQAVQSAAVVMLGLDSHELF
jgi:hypothetical protein